MRTKSGDPSYQNHATTDLKKTKVITKSKKRPPKIIQAQVITVMMNLNQLKNCQSSTRIKNAQFTIY